MPYNLHSRLGLAAAPLWASSLLLKVCGIRSKGYYDRQTYPTTAQADCRRRRCPAAAAARSPTSTPCHVLPQNRCIVPRMGLTAVRLTSPALRPALHTSRTCRRAPPTRAMLLEHLPALEGRRIVLASASPRRRELLSAMGVKFEVRGGRGTECSAAAAACWHQSGMSPLPPNCPAPTPAPSGGAQQL